LTALPIIKSIPFCDPLAAFAPLAADTSAIFLDSALKGESGRFSYIAADPFCSIRCTPYPWAVTIDGRPIQKDAFTTVAHELARFSIKRPPNAPVPFLGGAVGFFSYELGGVLETLPIPKSTPSPWDMVIGFYDVVAAFDLEKRQAWVISSGFPESEQQARLQRAENRAQHMIEMLGTEPLPPTHSKSAASWQCEISKEAYESSVSKAIEATYAGDIYQANFSQRFLTDMPTNMTPFETYLHLRENSPAPFSAFVNAGDGMYILSASPERFLRVSPERNVDSRPIKGTRARGTTPETDEALAEELRKSPKDRAENLMIVDLLRNDLSRVCRPGTVSVPTLCDLKTYPTVHHLVSTVTGALQQGKASMDLLQATFPGGSITGAPKIRAMEIIHDLEASARGPYCGTITWLGFDGTMDSSIVIRTIVVNGKTVVAQAGGAVVAESDPMQEYEESLIKAQPLLAAFEHVGAR